MELYYKIRFYFWLLGQKKKNTIYLLGTPVHENIGDSAISLAEICYLKKIVGDNCSIIEVDQQTTMQYLDVIRLSSSKNDLIILHGGGNMGDEWMKEENDRRKIVSNFPNNKIIIMPQTVFYKDVDKLNLSSEFYKKYQNLTIVAREAESYKILKENYDNRILLTPDIVLSMKNEINMEQFNRKGILFCFRNDGEIAIDDKEKNIIIEKARSFNENVKFTDMISDITMNNSNREEIIRNKLKEIASAELVITDRLHGMVFCYLTNTPCLVYSNYNQKVLGTYNWIKECGSIRPGRTDILKKQIKDLLECQCSNNYFDFSLFQELTKEIKDHIK